MSSSVPAPKFYRLGSDRFVVLSTVGTVLSYTFEGPLRYALQLAGAETLLYLRDAFALACVALVAGSWIAGQTLATPLVAVTCVLLAHLAIGLVSLPSAFQALFGFKIFLPYLLGFVLAPLLETRRRELVQFSALILVATSAGVFLNYFVEFPWIGSTYESAFATTSVAVRWWIDGGIQRLPGFARASYDAAALSLLALVPLLATQIRLRYKLLLIALSTYTVVLTTSKAPLLALPAFVLEGMLANGMGPAIANAYLVLLGGICLAVPLVAVQLEANAAQVPAILSSFMERVVDMWPGAFALFESPGQVIWGRGTGGIGTAQTFGEWSKTNSADNLMVYVLVTFGLLGLIYIGVFLFKLFQYLHARPGADFLALCAGGWTALWLTNGITTNMIEEPATNLVAGLMFGIAFCARQPHAPAARAVPVRAATPIPRLHAAGGESWQR